jgi:hypothetical protein
MRNLHAPGEKQGEPGARRWEQAWPRTLPWQGVFRLGGEHLGGWPWGKEFTSPKQPHFRNQQAGSDLRCSRKEAPRTSLVFAPGDRGTETARNSPGSSGAVCAEELTSAHKLFVLLFLFELEPERTCGQGVNHHLSSASGNLFIRSSRSSIRQNWY